MKPFEFNGEREREREVDSGGVNALTVHSLTTLLCVWKDLIDGTSFEINMFMIFCVSYSWRLSGFNK